MSDYKGRLIEVERVPGRQGDIAQILILPAAIIEADCEPLLIEITEALRTVSPRLAIDFRRLGHVSSAMLGVLVRVKNRAAEAGGAIALFDLPEEIMTVMSLTRLDAIFPIAGDAADAIALLEAGASDG
ncbi:MAG: STAS domain-containing protein [Planctomycetota bacterium]